MANIFNKMLEDKIKNALRVRYRFKAIVRQVIQNAPWLIDDDFSESDLKLSENQNVQRNVMKIMYERSPFKGITIKEKALLRKDVKFRTNQEKHHLKKIFGSLQCFRRYPLDVRQKLVETTYFEFFEAGRTLLKQGHQPLGMYFIVSGEVILSHTELDEVSNEYVTLEITRRNAGKMFGETALLHNEAREYTCTSSVPCELLCLKKDDFDRILKETLQKNWDDIVKAMSEFSYFDEWTKNQKRECCLVSKIRNYEPEQVILGDGIRTTGTLMVFFIIEGHCKIIEHLLATEEFRKGMKTYKSFEPNLYLKEIEKSKSIIDLSAKTTCSALNLKDNALYQEAIVIQSLTIMASNILLSVAPLQKCLERISEVKYPESDEAKRKSADLTLKDITLPSKVKLHFMQVGILEKGCFFKVNDKYLKNRRIISASPLKCLIIPDYWLTQHNKCKIWQRVESYLSLRIPTNETVFEQFKTDMKWKQYQKKLEKDIYKQKKMPRNDTTIRAVPYSIRIKYPIIN